MNNFQLQYVAPQTLRPYAGNARTHSKKQIKQIANSIERFGFLSPLVVCRGEVLVGNGLQASTLLGLKSVPIIVVEACQRPRGGLRPRRQPVGRKGRLGS
jgi:ParB-like chromosome segregation protein Spo0J